MNKWKAKNIKGRHFNYEMKNVLQNILLNFRSILAKNWKKNCHLEKFWKKNGENLELIILIIMSMQLIKIINSKFSPLFFQNFVQIKLFCTYISHSFFNSFSFIIHFNWINEILIQLTTHVLEIKRWNKF